MIHNELSHYFDDAFADKRIDKRANKTLGNIIRNGSIVVNRCCDTLSEKIGAYRMLNNEKLEIDLIKQCLYQNCTEHIKGKHLLCIEDTTEINCNSHIGRIEPDDPDIGPVTKNSNMGFYCHPMLAVDAESHIPLGFSAVKLWNRRKDKEDRLTRKYRLQPIEEKESYRWIEAARESLDNLPQDVQQTIIADRESDIYEAFHLLPNDRCNLLFRSSANRILVGEESLLSEYMCSLPSQHTYDLEIKGNHSRQSRTAWMNLRFGEVDIKKPKDLKGDYPASIRLTCIHVVEHNQTVPNGETPVEWRLLTTHPIENIADAMQCVEWYKLRWYIEEIFRLLKSEGMNIEHAQLESGATLKKLTLMGLIGAWHIMTLKLAHDRKEEGVSARILFTHMQIELLDILLRKVEGNTQKQKNPYVQYSLAWAAWIIARLAGWSGYGSHGKAGYITFKRGYQKYIDQYQAFELFKDVYKE